MGFHRFVKDVSNGKSRLRRTLSRWGNSADHAITKAGRFAKIVGPALMAAQPELAPAVGGALGALGTYEQLRSSIKGSS